MSDAARDWYGYVHFAIVIQSTIGCRDFQPLADPGSSRASRRASASSPLGLLIAKITTASISRYNLLQKEACVRLNKASGASGSDF